nr:ureidoglycolate lyase [Deinococcus aestuarii]
MIAHQRDPLLTQIERHVRTPEVFLALDGRSLFVVGAPGEADPVGLRAFVIGPGQGVLLHPGTWHWAPYPITPTATFLLVLRAETPEHDIETLDIPPHRLEARAVPSP